MLLFPNGLCIEESHYTSLYWSKYINCQYIS